MIHWVHKKRERERERESGYTGLINIASGLDLEWMEFYILYSFKGSNKKLLSWIDISVFSEAPESR